jgi:uncharacterized membrane protein
MNYALTQKIPMSMPSARVQGTTSRVDTIDFLRGLVMIIMALDHVRDYFHFDSFLYSPTDLQHTTVALFATRWITHLCAPTFLLLAGTSTYFMCKRKGKKDVSIFLLTRGVWLIVLQLTLIRFGWNFDPLFHYNSHSIISVIGLCMIALSALIHLPWNGVLITGLTFVIGHNLLDGISFESGTIADVLWSFLHAAKTYQLGHGYSFSLIYPLIPWTGVIAVGYCLGRLYDDDYAVAERKKELLMLGGIALLTFFLLRYLNFYGDPTPWTSQQNMSTTILSFFNVEKYPPSLLYLCATLGIALIVLGLTEGRDLNRFQWVTLFGRVAFFYYVLHIFTIHTLALVAAVATGHPWQEMVYLGSKAAATEGLRGTYGFNLGVVYMVWMSVVLLLYPCCVRWNAFKEKNKGKWWTSYV